MPQLSVILVNYKVPHFLEHCLLSVQKAMTGIQSEIIVIDNASGDGSIDRLAPRFPTVRFISSDQNLGFAKACNWGYRESTGEYILFLNPDTLLSEDSLSKPIDFLRIRPDIGAMGIRMIDGTGKFLPESKRAFPDPATALYKIVGLSKIFPRSPRFARYHLGHLSPDRDHPIDVVAGAYFLVSRAVLEKTGVFDERFFMYGEDIDLSYRIQQAGFTNHYYSGSTILHFKGESTQKQSFRYVKLFYGAMSRFVNKHRLHAGWFSLSIQAAIGFRAGLSGLRRTIQRIGIPVWDALWVFLVFSGIARLWGDWVRTDVNYTAGSRLSFAILALIFSAVSVLGGLNRAPFRWSNFFRSTLLASGILLIIYALLPESLRYSRGVVLFGCVFSVIFLGFWRLLLLRMQLVSTYTDRQLQFPLLVIGSAKSHREVQHLYPDQPSAAFLNLEPNESIETMTARVNGFSGLIRFSDILFCTSDLSYRLIFLLMEKWGDRFSYRFYDGETDVILPLQKE